MYKIYDTEDSLLDIKNTREEAIKRAEELASKYHTGIYVLDIDMNEVTFQIRP